MRRARLWLLGAAGLCVSGFTNCLSNLASDPMGAALTATAGTAESALKAELQAKEECAPLEKRQVAFDEERSLGGAVSLHWVGRGGGLTEGAALQRQLNLIGRHVAHQSTRPTLPWTFGVLDSPGINAVSAPGGFVFVSKGLVRALDDEAQLAGALAHEVAHVALKHAVTEYHQLLVTQCHNSVLASSMSRDAVEGVKRELGTLPAGAGRALVDAVTRSGGALDLEKVGTDTLKAITEGLLRQLTEKGFRAEDEFAADALAVELMAQAGYAPQAYLALLEKVPEQGLSTAHPHRAERRARLQAHLEAWRQRAARGEFVPADLARTRVVPLRDAVRALKAGVAAAE